MTQKEINEGNKLIAEFMGIKTSYYSGEFDMVEINNKMCPLERWAKYHSNWDWVMPVLEKIESMGYSVCLESRSSIKNRCVIFKSPILIDTGRPDKPWIGSVWSAVVTFIKEINSKAK